MKTVTVQLNSNPSGVSHFLLTAQSSAFAGLSSAFAVDASLSGPQTSGIISAESGLHFSVDAILKNGRQVRCDEEKGLLDFIPSLNAERLNLNCEGTPVSLKISAQAAGESDVALIRTRQSLAEGASLLLANADEREHLLELTLKDNSMSIAERSSADFPPATVHFTAEEISGFLNSRAALNFPCQISACAENFGPLSITLKPDGEIIARRTVLKDSTQVVFRRAGSEGLRVATYNVENFWDDDAENSTPYNDFSKDLSDWYSGQFAQRKALRIRDALLAAGLPDVVGLQEIESAANSSRSLELLKPVLSPLGYNFYALGQQAGDNPTAVTTAFISKYPIIENTRLDFLFDSAELTADNRPDFTGASRDPQRVTVALPEGIGLTLINSHWKSKRDNSPVGDQMRLRIGALMREHLSDLGRIQGGPAAAIIMGDFNADYREAPVQQGLQLAPTLASARRDPSSLFNLWQTRPALRQGNYPHDSNLNALDNLVVTQPLLNAGSLTLNSSLMIAGDFGTSFKKLRNGDGLPLRSQRHQIKEDDGQLRTFHKDAGYSDHLPLIAEFRRSLSTAKVVEAAKFSQQIENQSISSLAVNPVPDSFCADGETRKLSRSEISSALLSASRGDCFEINSPLMLRKTGLFNVAFDLPAESHSAASERIVIISADRPFGANKNWLRQTLQQSSGKTLTRLHGRLGLIDGVKALFISRPAEDVVFEYR
jgi:endonuclease/exonuclease/phosphatase family metal-dependent hydrolase